MDSRKAQIATVLLSSFAQGLVGSAFPASAAVLRGQGLTDPQYGSIFLPQMVLAAVGATGAGFVLDRLGAKRVLGLGFVLMALSQAALGAVVLAGPGWTYPLALLGTSLLGLGAGVSAGPLNAYPQVLFTSRSESAVVALHTVVGVGLAVTPVLAGAALDRGLWLAVPCSSPRRTSRSSSSSSGWTCPSRSLATPGPRSPGRWALLCCGSSSESPRSTGSPSPSTPTGRSSSSRRSAASAWRRRASR